jgi:Na+-transporting methylmalonyl-CoA/oxaloacetate decarboxylase gamma subunit
LQISAVGMGLVFALLGMLWCLLNLALRLDRPPATDASAPAPAAEPSPAAAAVTARGDPATDPALRAAITVALQAHEAFLRGGAAPQVRQRPPGQLHLSRWVAAGRMRQTQTWQRGR